MGEGLYSRSDRRCRQPEHSVVRVRGVGQVGGERGWELDLHPPTGAVRQLDVESWEPITGSPEVVEVGNRVTVVGDVTQDGTDGPGVVFHRNDNREADEVIGLVCQEVGG